MINTIWMIIIITLMIITIWMIIIISLMIIIIISLMINTIWMIITIILMINTIILMVIIILMISIQSPPNCHLIILDGTRWSKEEGMALVKLAEEGLDLRDHPIQHYLTGSRINIVFYPISPSPVTGIRGVDVKPSRVTDDTDDTLQLSKFSPDNNLQVSPLVTHALLARERMRVLSPKHLVWYG